MKKIMNTVVGCFAAMAIALNGTAASAAGMDAAAQAEAKGFYQQDNTIDVCIDPLTEEEAAQYSQSISKLSLGRVAVCEGDYKVTVRIFNNSGFANTGFRLMFDVANFEPIVYYTEDNGAIKEHPAFAKGKGVSLSHDFAINRFENDDTRDYGQIAWGTMGLSDVEKNGAIYSFFFTRKEGAPANAEEHLVRGMKIVSWKNADREEVICNLNTTGVYMRSETLIGDVDENGVVDNIDALRMLEFATAMLTTGSNQLADYDWNEECSANPKDPDAPVYQVCYLSGAADVNNDNNVDVEDAMEILQYYVQEVVCESEYEGCVGDEAFVYHFVES